MCYGQPRDIVVSINVPPMSADGVAPQYLEATVVYKHALTGVEERVSVNCTTREKTVNAIVGAARNEASSIIYKAKA